MTTTHPMIEPLPVCCYGHPLLRRKSVQVDRPTPEIRALAERMMVTMREHEGIGLAAPQVGRNLNLVVVNIPPPPADDGPVSLSPGEMALLPRMPLVLLNITLSEFSEEESVFEEGCLSVPGVHADITRPVALIMTAETLHGNVLRYPCGGLLARCLQHEVDHLNGVLFVDLADDESLKPYRRTLKRLEKQAQKALKTR